MPHSDKPLVWLRTEIKTPPFSASARTEAGYLLRRLQRGEKLAMPESRPMPSIGPRCHELRVNDTEARRAWRIFYRIDDDAIVVAVVEQKTTQRTTTRTLDLVRRRLKQYDQAAGG